MPMKGLNVFIFREYLSRNRARALTLSYDFTLSLMWSCRNTPKDAPITHKLVLSRLKKIKMEQTSPSRKKT